MGPKAGPIPVEDVRVAVSGALAVQDSELHVLEEASRRPGVPLSVHNVVPLALAGEPAERLTARALGEGTNFGMLVAEILEAEARHR
jgi:hypothetical protein